jgi:glucoamylase
MIFPERDMEKVLGLMMNNVITKENVISGQKCLPGAIVASPSTPDDPETDQNYNYDWVRDSAITMLCIIETIKKSGKTELKRIIWNYIEFVSEVQRNSSDVSLGYARWKLDGKPSDKWSIQNDGPALRIIAICHAIEIINEQHFYQKALQCIRIDGDYICRKHDDLTCNIWEEFTGSHFFVKIVMRKALYEILKHGISLNDHSHNNINSIIHKIGLNIRKHWTKNYYNSQSDSNIDIGNDVNMAVVMGLKYGEYENDHYMLSSRESMLTIAKTISMFSKHFSINTVDDKLGIGPSIGRYPSDNYDGDILDDYDKPDDVLDFGHPWFICTNTMAYCFYRIAECAKTNNDVLNNANNIFETTFSDYTDIVKFGNKFIFATRRHWDNCHMSEQYDRNTGYMRSVRDLTWSYSTYLSAHWKYYDVIK